MARKRPQPTAQNAPAADNTPDSTRRLHDRVAELDTLLTPAPSAAPSDSVSVIRVRLRQELAGVEIAAMADARLGAAQWEKHAGELWALWRDVFPEDCLPPPPHRAPRWNKAEYLAARDTIIRALNEMQAATTRKNEQPRHETAAEVATSRPRWDRATRQLSLDDAALRLYRREARAQFAILDAFQSAGWPPSIPCPSEVLGTKDAVDGLNDGLADTRLRFQPRRQNDGPDSIGWRLTPV